jgi:hypothetical protein
VIANPTVIVDHCCSPAARDFRIPKVLQLPAIQRLRRQELQGMQG